MIVTIMVLESLGCVSSSENTESELNSVEGMKIVLNQKFACGIATRTEIEEFLRSNEIQFTEQPEDVFKGWNPDGVADARWVTASKQVPKILRERYVIDVDLYFDKNSDRLIRFDVSDSWKGL